MRKEEGNKANLEVIDEDEQTIRKQKKTKTKNY